MHGKSIAAAALLLVVLASGAFAETADDLDFFVGGDTAVSIFQDYDRPPGVRVDDVDFSWSFSGGVRYKWLGVSAGYVDFGELQARAPGFRDRVEYRGATVSALVFLPVNEDFHVYGEVGGLFWEQDVDFDDSVTAFEADEDDSSWLVGVGASYRIPDTPVSLTARYNRYFEVGDAGRTGHDNDIDRVGVGVALVF
jgi:hypothetical protein